MSLNAQHLWIENKGQYPAKVIASMDMKGQKIFLEKGRLVFHQYENIDKHDKLIEDSIKCHAYSLNWLNHTMTQNISWHQRDSGLYHFYLGKDTSKWASNCRAFQKIKVSNLYPGVDLELFGTPNGLKYQYIVAPNTDISQIQIEFKDIKKVLINEQGSLLVQTTLGVNFDDKPMAFLKETKEQIPISFALRKNQVFFDLAQSSFSDTLYIDPEIIFSSFTGSSADNFGTTATYDAEENLYGSGTVFNIGYPITTGAYRTGFSGKSVIGVSKFDKTGRFFHYSAQIGGNGSDVPNSIYVNKKNELLIFGVTSSSDYPTTASAVMTNQPALQTGSASFTSGYGVNFERSADIIVSKLSANGSQLLASTYYGGNGMEGLSDFTDLVRCYGDHFRGKIEENSLGHIVVGSCTNSTNLPYINGFQKTNGGGWDGLLLTFNSDLSQVLYGSYYGGSQNDIINDISLNQSNEVYATGVSRSTNLQGINGFDPTPKGGNDGFVVKFSADFNNIPNGTYVSTANYDNIYLISYSPFTNSVFIAGQTDHNLSNYYILNSNFPSQNKGQFIMELSENLSTKVRSMAFGTEDRYPDLVFTSFRVDDCKNINLAAYSFGEFKDNNGVDQAMNATGLPTTLDALFPNVLASNGNAFYFMIIEQNMNSLKYGSFFGAQNSTLHVDGGTSRFDEKGILYQAVCAACSNSSFPIYVNDKSVVSSTRNSNNCNLGVIKFNFTIRPKARFEIDLDCQGGITNLLDYDSTQNNAKSLWLINDSIRYNSHKIYHRFSKTGSQKIQHILSIANGECIVYDTFTRFVFVPNGDTVILDTIYNCTVNLEIGLTDTLNFPKPYTTSWYPNKNLVSISPNRAVVSPKESIDYIMTLNIDNCLMHYKFPIAKFGFEYELIQTENKCLQDTVKLVGQSHANKIFEYKPKNTYFVALNDTTMLIRIDSPHWFNYIIKDTITGCSYENEIYLTVDSSLRDRQISADPDTIAFRGISNLSILSPAAVSFLWSEDSTLSALNTQFPQASPLEETMYYVTLTNAKGCQDLDSIKVYVYYEVCDDPEVFIPNTFTPNQDGQNDIFQIRGDNLTSTYLMVYDKWGQKVFESGGEITGWDGTFQGKYLPNGVYYYYAAYSCYGNRKNAKKGTIMLIK
jgi:gliding motility-associated-like protein